MFFPCQLLMAPKLAETVIQTRPLCAHISIVGANLRRVVCFNLINNLARNHQTNGEIVVQASQSRLLLLLGMKKGGNN